MDWAPGWSQASPKAGDGIVIATGTAIAFAGDSWLHDHASLDIALSGESSPALIGYCDGRAVYVARPARDAVPPEQLVPLREALLREDDATAAMLGTACQVLHWQRDHQFCGRCGTVTTEHGRERAKWCPVCEIPFYPRLAPCIIVQIIDGDKIFLARSSRHTRNMYSLVAGFIEPGENAEAAVAREIAEETGLRVDNIRYVESQQWPFPHQLMLGFFADLVGGELRLQPDELATADWFDASDLPPIPPVATIAGRLIRRALAGESQSTS